MYLKGAKSYRSHNAAMHSTVMTRYLTFYPLIDPLMYPGRACQSDRPFYFGGFGKGRWLA